VSEVQEIERDLTREEAQALTVTIRGGMERVHRMLIDAYRGRAWVALEYPTWESYCDAELHGARPKLPAPERREIVGEMREAGMSQRAIASGLGVAQNTVQRDLGAGERKSSPTDSNGKVTGTDGKSYVAARPSPVDQFADWTPEERALRARLESGDSPVVVSLRGQHTRLIGWAEREGRYERIDRRSQWGNPFELPADGDRVTVIRNYEDHYLPFKPSLLAKLPDLRGKALGCWCAPEACHGDVLARWVNDDRR